MLPRILRLAAAAGVAAAAAALPAFVGAPPKPQPMADDQGFVLHVLSNASAAKFGGYCLDGTPPGFYIRRGSGMGANKWLLHQRGGAWCTSLDDCLSRASSDLGSSKYFLPNISATPNIYQGIMTGEATNPMSNWNVVFAQYCDGSSWTSDNDNPIPYKGATLWFRGARAQAAVFAELEALGGALSTATDFVFTGTSAGALSVYLTAERVRGYFDTPARAAAGTPLRFVALPDSGLFLDALDVAGNPTFRNGFLAAWGPALWNNSRGTNQRCIAAMAPADGWKCSFAPVVYPAFTAAGGVPFFVSQSMADQWQVGSILGLPCTPGSNCNAQYMAAFNAFQATLQATAVAAHKAAPASDGMYLTGCYQHGQTCSDGDYFSQAENGQSQAATFNAWYTGAGGATSEFGAPWPAAQACYNGAHGWC